MLRTTGYDKVSSVWSAPRPWTGAMEDAAARPPQSPMTTPTHRDRHAPRVGKDTQRKRVQLE